MMKECCGKVRFDAYCEVYINERCELLAGDVTYLNVAHSLSGVEEPGSPISKLR